MKWCIVIIIPLSSLPTETLLCARLKTKGCITPFHPNDGVSLYNFIEDIQEEASLRENDTQFQVEFEISAVVGGESMVSASLSHNHRSSLDKATLEF